MRHAGIWIWGAAITLFGMAHAHAQARQSVDVTRESIVQRMDRSGDGRIDTEEFRNAMMRVYSAADGDDDGMLSGKEIPAHSLVAETSKTTADEVKRGDYSAALQRVFDRFDTDHDGSLAGDEIEAFAQARRSVQEAQP